jgi:starch synthase (maltosyl-transferring)
MTQDHPSVLDALRRELARRASRCRWAGYRIPDLWSCWGFARGQPIGKGELAVNPYALLLDCLDREILPRRIPGCQYRGRSLSWTRGVQPSKGGGVRDQGRRRRAGDWIRTGSIYGMLVRTTTAWDHDGDGALSSRRWTETGTFLKSILLLPLLRRMGVTTVYLLPIAKHSNLYRKGELGCPYSAKNFLEIEPSLHDRLLGDQDSEVEMVFAAFVEAAHVMGMRVMLDLAPRTASRDNDWILEHPDWFYWIGRRFEPTYAAPHIDGADYPIPKPSDLRDLHRREIMRGHLAKFRFAPNVTAPAKWQRFVRRMQAAPPRNLLAEIAREFGVITPPGFSDIVNDRQPPWSDVTFLRLFWDHPQAVVQCLSEAERQPPYVFSEVIKASHFSGRKPNRELWEQLANILPFYQRFGVDGARIDMGHALPKELEEMILSAPRRIDPDFCFVAEELGTGNSGKARRAGYNMVIGPSWWMQPRARQGKFHEFVHKVLPGSKLPVWGAAETPDTPRAVTRTGGKRFVHLAAAVNHFLPNAVPFVNSGMEVYERQPMNLGLDIVPPGRYALDKTDPYCGKLAFFDRYVLHWNNPGGTALVKRIGEAGALRARFAEDLGSVANYFNPAVTTNRKLILAVGCRVEQGRRALLMAANTDYRKARRAVLTGLSKARRGSAHRSARRSGPKTRHPEPELLFEVGGVKTAPKATADKVAVNLPPGGVAMWLL